MNIFPNNSQAFWSGRKYDGMIHHYGLAMGAFRRYCCHTYRPILYSIQLSLARSRYHRAES